MARPRSALLADQTGMRGQDVRALLKKHTDRFTTHQGPPDSPAAAGPTLWSLGVTRSRLAVRGRWWLGVAQGPAARPNSASRRHRRPEAPNCWPGFRGHYQLPEDLTAGWSLALGAIRTAGVPAGVAPMAANLLAGLSSPSLRRGHRPSPTRRAARFGGQRPAETGGCGSPQRRRGSVWG